VACGCSPSFLIYHLRVLAVDAESQLLAMPHAAAAESQA
jgi:hypothetical protein